MRGPMGEPVSCVCEQKPRAQAKASEVVSLDLACVKGSEINYNKRLCQFFDVRLISRKSY